MAYFSFAKGRAHRTPRSRSDSIAATKHRRDTLEGCGAPLREMLIGCGERVSADAVTWKGCANLICDEGFHFTESPLRSPLARGYLPLKITVRISGMMRVAEVKNAKEVEKCRTHSSPRFR
jgi:hypothetical protein